jgi:uncharacterized protein YfdQ (DUF2303 family)
METDKDKNKPKLFSKAKIAHLEAQVEMLRNELSEKLQHKAMRESVGNSESVTMSHTRKDL